MENSDYSDVAVMLQELYSDHRELRPSYYDKIDTRGLPELFDASNLKIVATENDNVVGFVRGETVTKSDKVVAVIHDIFVDKRNRGKGTGAVLMQTFYQEARSAGATILQLQVDTKNQTAISFWESEGFESSHLRMIKLLD